jgi:hypothetical protein
MSENFLTTFMQVAQTITQAERGLVVDTQLNVVETFNLTQAEIETEAFAQVAQPNLQQALENGEVIITNNLIGDASQAPTTNTSFTNLRAVIVLPIPSYGALYLDRPIRSGMISRAVIDKLEQVAVTLVENNQENSNAAQMQTMYESL